MSRLDESVCRRLDFVRGLLPILETLPPHLVVVLWLRGQGWTLREIAEAHGVSVTQVWLWRQQLQRRLSAMRGVAA